MIFFFSGCGNSRFIAESISQAINEPIVFIPEAKRENHFEYTLAEGERGVSSSRFIRGSRHIS